MKYKEYLQTNHWKELREEILSKRNSCQRCGVIKKEGIIFNLHHTNYKCLFKETFDDLLLLCQKCHTQCHSQKKWKKKYEKRESLNFVKRQNPLKKIYNLSNVLRHCDRCGLEHPVAYKRYKNNTLHLYITCPNSKPRFRAIPFEDGLDIPVLGGKKFDREPVA